MNKFLTQRRAVDRPGDRVTVRGGGNRKVRLTKWEAGGVSRAAVEPWCGMQGWGIRICPEAADCTAHLLVTSLQDRHYLSSLCSK